MLANFQVKPLFLRSRNTVGLVRILYYVRVSNISNMAACYRRWIGNNAYLSLYTHDSNEIPTAISMFSMSSNTTGLIYKLPFVGWVRNKKWRPETGSGYGITYIWVCIHDSNEITTAIPMFLASSIITELIRILFRVRVYGKFVAYTFFRLQAAIFDIPLTLT